MRVFLLLLRTIHRQERLAGEHRLHRVRGLGEMIVWKRRGEDGIGAKERGGKLGGRGLYTKRC